MNRYLFCRRTFILSFVVLTFIFGSARVDAAQQKYPDKLVWVFGWNLTQDSHVDEITKVLDVAGEHGFTGAMFSLGLDTLCKKPPEYFDRLARVQAACERNKLEFIPAVFSVGYGGAALSHNRYLAAGIPVRGVPFVVHDGRATLIPDPDVTITNGGFEAYKGDRATGFRFHDQPGEVSFIDTEVRHDGNASLRLENFTANEHGHGRVMQEVAVKPHRCYRVSMWLKTERIEPARQLMIQVLAGSRSLAPMRFKIEPTSDWHKYSLVFNSLEYETVRIYAGIWGGRSGKFWVDDWSIEELGPINVLRRDGTPVTVTSDDGSIVYQEGKDYAPIVDPNYSPYRIDRPAPTIEILPGGRIGDGDRIRASWYHSLAIGSGQVSVCMAEPELYEIFDHEMKLIAEHVKPKRVMLNMDEIRMGGTCCECGGRDMAKLLGECITRQVATVRRYVPDAEVFIWSDMLDPGHNAHDDYYLVDGDYTGSWNYIPKDITIAVWGGNPRPKSLKFFADQGFKMLVACYYDADDLESTRRWKEAAQEIGGVKGFMYTPWQKKYELLPGFGDMIR